MNLILDGIICGAIPGHYTGNSTLLPVATVGPGSFSRLHTVRTYRKMGTIGTPDTGTYLLIEKQAPVEK
jgi:hypothetical protein